MASIKELGQEYQDQLVKGIDSLFALQKQLIASTFELYEKSLALREKGYSKTKQKIDELTSLVEKQLGTGQEKVTSTLENFADRYLPESKDRIQKVEKLIEQNVSKLADQMKDLLAVNVDQNVQKTFNYEKELMNKVKELFDKNISNYESQVYKLLGVPGQKNPVAKKQATEQKAKIKVKNPTPTKKRLGTPKKAAQ